MNEFSADEQMGTSLADIFHLGQPTMVCGPRSVVRGHGKTVSFTDKVSTDHASERVLRALRLSLPLPMYPLCQGLTQGHDTYFLRFLVAKPTHGIHTLHQLLSFQVVSVIASYLLGMTLSTC